MRHFKGLLSALLFALVGLGTCSPAVAQQNVVFNNSDGMFSGTSATSGDLSLDGSTLIGISGFANNLAGYNSEPGNINNSGSNNIGTLNFTTGALTGTFTCPTPVTCMTASPTMVPLTNEISQFAGGGPFKVNDTYNGGFGGFIFKGTFQSASWACAAGDICKSTGKNTWKGTWSFTGTLTNVMLKIDGETINVGSGPITIQSTTEKGVVATMSNGRVTFTDSAGNTNFSGNFSVAPEPGSLALFGSGLIVVGLITRRRLTAKGTTTQV